MDAHAKPPSAGAKSAGGHPCEEAVPCSKTLPSPSPVCPPRPLRPITPNTGAIPKILIDGGDVCEKEANGGISLSSHRPQAYKVNLEIGVPHVEVKAPGIAPETCQPPVPGTVDEGNGVPVHSGSVPLKFDSVRLDTGAPLGAGTGECIRNQGGSRGGFAEACGGEARHKSGGVALGGAAGGTPTWVVKPAANSNCGFGIHICCSLKVTAAVPPFSRFCLWRNSNQTS